MNNKLMLGAAAGVAAIALAVGGTTYSAFSDFGDINNNTVGAGFLKLDLGVNGTGNAALDWGKLAPGNVHATRTIWVASNDGQSVPNATLALTFHNLQDQENGCSSNGELAADQNCAQANDPGAVEGTDLSDSVLPGHHRPGNLPDRGGQLPPAGQLGVPVGPCRRPLPVRLRQRQHLPVEEHGWLWAADSAARAGRLRRHRLVLGRQLRAHAKSVAAIDDAAQGDSLKFDVHFSLDQSF